MIVTIEFDDKAQEEEVEEENQGAFGRLGRIGGLFVQKSSQKYDHRKPRTDKINEDWTAYRIWRNYLKTPGISSDFRTYYNRKLYQPTLYFEDDDVDDSFCKKKIVFPFNMTLSEFKELLKRNLRGDAVADGKLNLHYVESMLCFLFHWTYIPPRLCITSIWTISRRLH